MRPSSSKSRLQRSEERRGAPRISIQVELPKTRSWVATIRWKLTHEVSHNTTAGSILKERSKRVASVLRLGDSGQENGSNSADVIAFKCVQTHRGTGSQRESKRYSPDDLPDSMRHSKCCGGSRRPVSPGWALNNSQSRRSVQS